MKKMKKIVAGTLTAGLMAAASAAPVLPGDEYPLLYSYKVDYAHQFVDVDKKVVRDPSIPVFEDVDGDGQVSVSVFQTPKGLVYVQIPDSQYANMGKAEGQRFNPKKRDFESLFQKFAGPDIAEAAVAVDACTGPAQTSGNSITYSLTIASGATVVVGAGSRDGVNSTTATYNGNAMTSEVSAGSPTHRIFSITNQASGAHNVVANFSGSNQISSAACSFTGTDTTDAIGATQTSTADTPPTLSITTLTNDSIVFDFVTVNNNTTLTAGSGQTKRGGASSGNHTYGISTEPKTTAGSVTMDWTSGNGPGFGSTQVAVEVRVPSAAVDSTNPSNFFIFE